MPDDDKNTELVELFGEFINSNGEEIATKALKELIGLGTTIGKNVSESEKNEEGIPGHRFVFAQNSLQEFEEETKQRSKILHGFSYVASAIAMSCGLYLFIICLGIAIGKVEFTAGLAFISSAFIGFSLGLVKLVIGKLRPKT